MEPPSLLLSFAKSKRRMTVGSGEKMMYTEEKEAKNMKDISRD
jgi:hypothetical protein